MSNILVKTEAGEEFSAYVAHPETDQPSSTIIVIQEMFGVNQNMRDICDGLANEGYIAVCPDLFWRQEPNVQLTDKTEEEWKRAFELYQGFDEDKGVKDLISTMDLIRQEELSNGLVGSMGFCLGGKLAYLMAARSDIDCSVGFYGVGIDAALDEAKNINNPCLLHMAELDEFVPPETQDKILNEMDQRNKIEVVKYDNVNHAFTRIGGEHYDQKRAHQANMKTADFLASNLS